MPRKPTEPGSDTLQAIQDRAFELFGRHGYEGVSIGDIARESGLSKGALYWHFSGKEDLFLACLKKLHRIFDQYVFDPMRAETDAVASVMALFGGLETLMRDPRVRQGVGGYWLVPSAPETVPLNDARRAFEKASQDSIREVLERGTAQGSFDLGGDIEDMSRAIIALLEAAILPLASQEPDDVHRILAVLARTLFRAYAKGDSLRELVDAM